MKIIFVSEIQDPYTRGSSTQILTENLLQGFKEAGHDIFFIAIYDSNNDANNIVNYYKKYTRDIIMVKSQMNLTTIANHKYKQLFQIIKGFTLYNKYMKIIPKIDVAHKTVLFSHTPSLEAGLICKALKKLYQFEKYIQYWSDPYALSGIYPENISIKRWPSYFIEKALLKIADSIVYPGKPIFLAQKKLYKKYSNKMHCVNYSYSCRNKTSVSHNSEAKLLFGYLGDYMSSIRNIKPLFKAFISLDSADLLVCGTGDVTPDNSNNIMIEKRVSQNEIIEIESKLDVFICIINHSCLQLPGKIFYQANCNKIILIILDGKYKDLFYNYLSSFNRFVFCDNNEESIKQAAKKICQGECKVDLSCIDKLSPKYVAECILNLNADNEDVNKY